MTTDRQREHVLRFYDGAARWMKPGIESMASDADKVISSGRERMAELLDELPYLDRPEHSMAASMFSCAAMLAVFDVLRERDVDAHAWGRAIHALPVVLPRGDDEAREQSRLDAEASQSGAAPNEFVFERVATDEQTDSGMNITSCAICQLFSKHDAMELVPYMCSFDDVMSDARGQGLRRTGTIALGAKQCDFRFKEGGEPLRLADQYPDRIRIG